MVDTETSPDRRQATLYTVGHSAHTSEALVSLLQEAEIDAICDVRTSPWSRWAPQHNQRELHAVLKANGIGYVWLGESLGGRPQGDEYYNDAGYVKYATMAKSERFKEGYERLTRGAQQMRVAVLCAEEDPVGCHRRLLIGRVADLQGWNVQHLRGDGTLISEVQLRSTEIQMTLFEGGVEADTWISIKPVQRR